jgi:hypothetical protein
MPVIESRVARTTLLLLSTVIPPAQDNLLAQPLALTGVSVVDVTNGCCWTATRWTISATPVGFFGVVVNGRLVDKPALVVLAKETRTLVAAWKGTPTGR